MHPPRPPPPTNFFFFLDTDTETKIKGLAFSQTKPRSAAQSIDNRRHESHPSAPPPRLIKYLTSQMCFWGTEVQEPRRALKRALESSVQLRRRRGGRAEEGTLSVFALPDLNLVLISKECSDPRSVMLS